jgi:hypothetical protein
VSISVNYRKQPDENAIKMENMKLNSRQKRQFLFLSLPVYAAISLSSELSDAATPDP